MKFIDINEYLGKELVINETPEWTDWIPVNDEELDYPCGDRFLPVPAWMEVKVKSAAGEYPDIKEASYFYWEGTYGELTLTWYKVRLH